MFLSSRDRAGPSKAVTEVSSMRMHTRQTHLECSSGHTLLSERRLILLLAPERVSLTSLKGLVAKLQSCCSIADIISNFSL